MQITSCVRNPNLFPQVSHHPPISCLHAEHDKWTFWQEYRMDSKFRPTYFKVMAASHMSNKLIFSYIG